jgi:hypothetical protein
MNDLRRESTISPPSPVQNGKTGSSLKPPGIPIGVILKSSPVEEEGYKNIINLSDWPNKPKEIKKSRIPPFSPVFFTELSTRF